MRRLKSTKSKIKRFKQTIRKVKATRAKARKPKCDYCHNPLDSSGFISCKKCRAKIDELAKAVYGESMQAKARCAVLANPTLFDMVVRHNERLGGGDATWAIDVLKLIVRRHKEINAYREFIGRGRRSSLPDLGRLVKFLVP